MKLKFKIFSKIIHFLIILIVFPFTFRLLGCSKTRSIQIANFESYMDQNLIDDLQKKYGINFVYYSTNEVIESKFEKYYDVAIPSTYEIINLWSKNLIAKIEWQKFNLKNKKGKKIITSHDALSLFNEEEIKAINDWVKPFTEAMIKKGKIKQNKPITNILDWCIPYFFQSLMFAYKGDKIDFYHVENNEEKKIEDSKITWNDVLYTITRKDSKFEKLMIGLIDDGKTIYDLGKIIKKENQQNFDEKVDIKKINDTFKYILEKLKSNKNIKFNLQSDSGIIASNLSIENKYAGALSWSGEIFYSATQCAEEQDHGFTAKEFHVVKPFGGLNAFDGIVINKNVSQTKHNQTIYKIIKQIALDSCDINDNFEIFKKNENGLFYYWSVQNFHKLGYTPTLKTLYDAINDEKSIYWNEFFINTSMNYDLIEQTKKMYIDIISLDKKDKNRIYSKPLNKENNSNIHWIWQKIKDQL